MGLGGQGEDQRHTDSDWDLVLRRTTGRVVKVDQDNPSFFYVSVYVYVIDTDPRSFWGGSRDWGPGHQSGWTW